MQLLCFNTVLVTLLMKESKMAAKIFEKQHQKYYKTYIIHIAFLVNAIVFNVVVMIIISVILTDCLIIVPYVKSFKGGTTTTTTGTEPSPSNLMSHASTDGLFTRLL